MSSRRNLAYLFSLIPAALVIGGNLAGGWWASSNFLFSLVFLGLLEVFSGVNKSNVYSDDSDFPEWILYLHVVLHTLAVSSLFYGIQSGRLWGDGLFLAILSTGVEAGSGAVVIAHELVHKASKAKRILGKYLLASVGNAYFYVHHLRIHHKMVGQHADAATARRGESLYRFFLRTLRQQFLQGWSAEKSRLSRQKQSAFSLQNEIYRNCLLQLLILGGLFFSLGFTAFAAYIGYALIASFLLEYVNYIEHYGLVRAEGARVGYEHSWNCDKIVSRFMLIDLSRHSDHHFHPSKPYHTLSSFPISPILPGGYASLVLPALIPPWWFAILHPKLDEIAK